jgi:hypothetical protein
MHATRKEQSRFCTFFAMAANLVHEFIWEQSTVPVYRAPDLGRFSAYEKFAPAVKRQPP